MNTTSDPSDLGDPSDPLYGAPLTALTGVFVYSRYTAVISSALLIHDLLLTIDDEVCLIFSYLTYFPCLTACLSPDSSCLAGAAYLAKDTVLLESLPIHLIHYLYGLQLVTKSSWWT